MVHCLHMQLTVFSCGHFLRNYHTIIQMVVNDFTFTLKLCRVLDQLSNEVSNIFSKHLCHLCQFFRIKCYQLSSLLSKHLFLGRRALVLFTGVACLDLFVQCNWTGPIPSLSSVLPQSGKESSNQQIIARLSQDGEVQ